MYLRNGHMCNRCVIAIIKILVEHAHAVYIMWYCVVVVCNLHNPNNKQSYCNISVSQDQYGRF